jgi:AhpD family alkylhydroperoxidase
MNRQEVNRELTQIFGAIPGFMNAVPDVHVGPLWEEMRKLQLEPGVIPAKYQQLIMLGVSTYAKCKYCTDFHTEVARTLGATKEEITETALLVGHTAQWSNFLGGTQYDFEQWKREVRTACSALAQAQKGGNGGQAQRPRA